MVVCYLAASAITTASRWTFWALGIAIFITLALIMSKDVGTLAQKRGKTVFMVRGWFSYGGVLCERGERRMCRKKCYRK